MFTPDNHRFRLNRFIGYKGWWLLVRPLHDIHLVFSIYLFFCYILTVINFVSRFFLFFFPQLNELHFSLFGSILDLWRLIWLGLFHYEKLYNYEKLKASWHQLLFFSPSNLCFGWICKRMTSFWFSALSKKVLYRICFMFVPSFSFSLYICHFKISDRPVKYRKK